VIAAGLVAWLVLGAAVSFPIGSWLRRRRLQWEQLEEDRTP
jgi:hypothetical protein